MKQRESARGKSSQKANDVNIFDALHGNEREEKKVRECDIELVQLTDHKHSRKKEDRTALCVPGINKQH
jgi:hypothetical protein